VVSKLLEIRVEHAERDAVIFWLKLLVINSVLLWLIMLGPGFVHEGVRAFFMTGFFCISLIFGMRYTFQQVETYTRQKAEIEKQRRDAEESERWAKRVR
jgi:hypothetical protein